MARKNSGPVQQYRGTTAQHSAYIGPVGELTVDTDKNVVVVHDGSTAGGHPTVPDKFLLKSAGGILKFNAGAEAPLQGDSIAVEIDLSALENALGGPLTAGDGIIVEDGNTISVNNTVLRTNVQQVITAVKTFDTGYFGKAVAVGSTVISPTNGAVFTKTITTDTTFSISAIPSGAASCFTLVLTDGGSHTVGWPSSVKWTEGTPPELITAGIDVITFITPNGGTTWYGCHSVQGVPAE